MFLGVWRTLSGVGASFLCGGGLLGEGSDAGSVFRALAHGDADDAVGGGFDEQAVFFVDEHVWIVARGAWACSESQMSHRCRMANATARSYALSGTRGRCRRVAGVADIYNRTSSL